MHLDLKHKIAIGLVTLLTAFAFGRFSAPEKIKTEIKTVEVVKTDTEKHKETIVTEVTKPDGTKEKVTKTVENTERKTDTKEKTDTIKEVTKSSSHLTLDVLAGLHPMQLSLPVYGLHMSTNIVGPVRIGIFGFTDGLGGVSLGLTF